MKRTAVSVFAIAMAGIGLWDWNGAASRGEARGTATEEGSHWMEHGKTKGFTSERGPSEVEKRVDEFGKADAFLKRFRPLRVIGSDALGLPSGAQTRRRVVETASSLGRLLVIDGEDGKLPEVYSAEHLVVSASDGSALTAVGKALVRSGLEVSAPFPDAGLLYVAMEAELPEEIDEVLAAAVAVAGEDAWVEMDGVGWAGGAPSDPNYGSQWHHQTIQSEAAWDLTEGSSSITVAVLDTGINFSLSEFSGRLVRGYDYANNDSDPTDDHGHGTAVAGTVASNANNGVLGAGVDWNCKIMPIKVLDDENNGFYSWWTSGVNRARTTGARVINLSAGGSTASTALTNAINGAIADGIIFVTITHNDYSGTVRYPGRLLQCITVGATERNDSKADFSNWGPEIDLVAPGRDIGTVNRGGGRGSWWGTSFAAPQVAGVAALLLSINPELDQESVSALLTVGAVDGVGDVNDTAGFDNYYGWGRLNVENTLLLAQTRPTMGRLADGRMRLNWAASANAIAKEPFTIEWSGTLGGWTEISSPAIRYGGMTEWIDDGSETGEHPGLAGQRNYRVRIGN